MRAFLKGGLAVVLCGIIAAPAAAQTASAAGPSSMKDMSCRDFLRLRQPEADQAIYFANGYSSGVEDQVAANRTTPASGGANGSGMAGPDSASWISLDDLQAICQASPSSRLLSMVPRGATGTTSGNAAGAQAQGNGRAATSGGGNSGAAAIGRSNPAPGAGASGVPSTGAVTTPGTTVTNPGTGTTTAIPGSTTSGRAAGTAGGTSAPAGGAASGAAGGGM